MTYSLCCLLISEWSSAVANPHRGRSTSELISVLIVNGARQDISVKRNHQRLKWHNAVTQVNATHGEYQQDSTVNCCWKQRKTKLSCNAVRPRISFKISVGLQQPHRVHKKELNQGRVTMVYILQSFLIRSEDPLWVRCGPSVSTALINHHAHKVRSAAVPEMRLDMMSGKIIILSILISTSPGNEMSKIVSSLRLWGRRTNPISEPTNTPLTVRTSSRLFLIHRSRPNTTRFTCTATHGDKKRVLPSSIRALGLELIPLLGGQPAGKWGDLMTRCAQTPSRLLYCLGECGCIVGERCGDALLSENRGVYPP